MDRTRWNDDLPTYLSERFYTKDEIDQLLERLSLQSGLLFNLSSPNSIIQSGDTNTFHTELTWSNGAGLEDKDIVYEVKHGETLIDLETVQTDVDGVAEYEYTGTGVGEVTVTAKYGSLLQETFVLSDTLFYDGGTTNDPSVSFWYTTGGTLTRTSEYSDVLENTGSTCYCRFSGTNYSIPSNGGVCEFDLYQVDGATNNSCIYIRDNTGYNNSGVSLTVDNLNGSVGEWIHVKLTIKNNKVYYITDKMTTESSKNITTTYDAYKLMFTCNNNITNLRFKNLKVYPI